ncbi:hypothetical protein NBRC116590_27140 [Pelagimonas sp. KU-00592-HH]|uniref:hypothetical protein n=1 Tax=Pelagimonas sp. KU-00592-HH TaxID=3127651 RepID=UPI003107562E
MLGVVLWSDNTENTAVIWCEDHGELAYFSGSQGLPIGDVTLDAGDLIQFDLKQQQNLRVVQNPRRVFQAAYSGLAERLVEADAEGQQRMVSAAENLPFGPSNVIPFTRKRTRERAGERVAV